MKSVRTPHVLVFLACVLAIASIVTILSDNRKDAFVSRDWPEICESGKLMVVMEYTPSSYMRVGDSITGEQYRLVKSLSERLGVPVEISLENDLQKSIDGLRRGEYDLVARLLPITTDMRDMVSFTDPFATDKQVLVQREKKDTTSDYVSSQLELPGKKIYVTANSPYIQRLSNVAEEIAADDFIVEQMSDYNEEQLAMLVSNGEIDYAVCDYGTASRSLAKYKNLDISVNISFTQLQAWAVREDSPILLDSINTWMKTLSKKRKR